MLMIIHVLSSFKVLSFTYLSSLGPLSHFFVVPKGALRKLTLCESQCLPKITKQVTVKIVLAISEHFYGSGILLRGLCGLFYLFLI